MKKLLSLRPQPNAKVPSTAMVMAAGKGTRMRPLTATRPKPLVEVGGETLLDHVLGHLRDAGVGRIVVNVHYLADSIEAHLNRKASDLDVHISDERDQLLETGGGLMKAKALLGDEPFLCVNTDNVWLDGPINSIRLMAEQWDAAKMDVLMLMVPLARATNHHGKGDFHMDPLGRLLRRKAGRVAPYVWTGIQIIAPHVLKDAPAKAFSTNVFWDRAIGEGRLYGMVHPGLWFDVGTPAAIPVTEAALTEL